MTSVVLTVAPADGEKAYTTRGQLFAGRVGDRVIVKRSTTPFCDAARTLLAEGVDPGTRLVMRYVGRTDDALCSTVGVAARLTVADDSGGKSIFRKWSPYDRAAALPEAPPVSEVDLAATLVAAAPEIASASRAAAALT